MVMQNLEKALFNVFQAIGTNYDWPNATETIQDVFNEGNTLRNPFFGQEASPVKFKFGTQKEVNAWLTSSGQKYPVVWLVYPVTKASKNNSSTTESYPNARLIFAINNKSDKLVETRIHTTKVVLDSLVSKFKELMRHSSFKKYISIDKVSDNREKWFPNYALTANQNANAVVDVWDVITLDTTIYLVPECIPLTN